jgi:hypothetical protein
MNPPIHTWCWLRTPAGDLFLTFTYEDPASGPSAKGSRVDLEPSWEQLERAIKRPEMTFQVSSPGLVFQPLPPDHVAAFRLPMQPEWTQGVGPSSGPNAGGQPWRRDPSLSGKLHPEFPDDLEVRFYFPVERALEQMWVRVTGVDVQISGYTGQLLNQPNTPGELRAGSVVSFRVVRGVPNPVWVTRPARENLLAWTTRCRTCGFDMLFEPVADVARKQFPTAPRGTIPVMFTTRCPLCAQTMTVEQRDDRPR